MATRADLKLDGNNLTIEKLAKVARDPSMTIDCDPSAMQRLEDAAALVSRVVTEYKRGLKGEGADDSQGPVMDYGITTGFGEFKRIPINPKRLNELQVNILLSHAAGVGENLDEDDLSNYFPPDVVRAVLILRINAFLKGHSGIRPAVVMRLVEMVNKRVIPLVPLRGSVGSSGDLAPLAHLFLVLCEEGRKATRFYQLAFDKRTGKWRPGPIMNATSLKLKNAASPPILSTIVEPELTPKEGLALTNGATFSAAMLALAVHDAKSLAMAADLAAAMSAEALLGCARAFDEKVHKARRQTGQIASAKCIRRLLEGSKLLERASEVQDPYSIRCAPAVHGASRDTLSFARKIVLKEIKAATDNPLFFVDEESAWDHNFYKNWPQRREKRLPLSDQHLDEEYDGKARHSYSAGNFHGQPIALAADFLAIALAEFANISERRTQLLMDHDHNRGLPANLIPDAGLNSGFMIAQYCAAGLVSENKVLTHPASVDSIPTSANSEDHNSMATIAARKLRTVLANTRHTLAIELLVATQALEWATLFEELSAETLPDDYKDLAEAYLKAKRRDECRQCEQQTAGSKKRDEWESLWQEGKDERELFEKWTRKANRNTISKSLGRGTGKAYRAIREKIKPMPKDRVLAEDIRVVAMLLAPEADEMAPLAEIVKDLTIVTTEVEETKGGTRA